MNFENQLEEEKNEAEPQVSNPPPVREKVYVPLPQITVEDEKQKPINNDVPTGWTRFFKTQYYQQYFQVAQAEVVERLLLSFMPFRRIFISKIKPNPDLYGPFWILTTIVFLVSTTGNLSHYFSSSQTTNDIFRLQYVRYGVVITYSFGFGFPSLIYFALQFMNCRTLELHELICLYGYSFGCFVLVFLLCIIPANWLQWLLMAYGAANSASFMVANMYEYLQELEKKKKLGIIGFICAVQIALFLVFKLVFFDPIYT